jgi:hypothetical protein
MADDSSLCVPQPGTKREDRCNRRLYGKYLIHQLCLLGK